MSTLDKVNQLFWLNYAREIKKKTGANFAKDGSAVFFLATEPQKGPPAGKFVPSEYTNTGLYHFANNLLATDQFFYASSGLHGYAQALRTSVIPPFTRVELTALNRRPSVFMLCWLTLSVT